MVSPALTTSRRWIASELRSLRTEVEGYSREFRRQYESAVKAEVGKLDKLEGLGRSDHHRIRVTVNDAARCYHAVHWLPMFKTAIRGRYRMQVLISAALAIISLMAFLALPRPSLSGLRAGNMYSYAFCVACVLTVVVGQIIHPRASRRFVAFCLFFECLVAFVAVYTYKRWSRYVPSAWHRIVSPLPLIHPGFKAHVASAHIGPYIQWALWVAGILSFVAITWRFINFIGKCTTSGLELGYGRAAEQSAELIIGFLNSCHTVSVILDGLHEMQCVNRENNIWSDRMARFPSDKERRELDRSLYFLARLVKPWHGAMRSSGGTAGKWIAGNAPRVEFFINYQRARNMFSGNNLTELRKAMASALVHAADGNWQLIGAGDEYPQTVGSKRWRRMLRRAIAVIIPIICAIEAGHIMRNFPTQYVQTVVIACLGFAALQLFGLIDPDSPARADVATRLAGMFKRGS